jgi:sulfate permease, SulP family
MHERSIAPAGHGGGRPRIPRALAPSSLIPVLTAAVVVGVVEVVIAISFAALIFSGPLAGHVSAGIGLSLFAAAVFLLLISLLSSQPGTIGSVQDASAAVLALVAASIAAGVPDEETRFYTAVLAIGLTSVIAGGLYFVLGTLRLGDLVRFVPYPVVGGFLAGTGWLLFRGGMGVLTQETPTLSRLPDFARADLLIKWLPGLAFAALLLFMTRRYRHFALIPGAIVGAIALFYAVARAAGAGTGTLEREGWLVGPFPSGALWEPWAISALGRADWQAIVGEAGGIATILILGLLALLLNASGIELALNREADLNRELRVAGVANAAAGAGGGMLGFQALSLTALAQRTGAVSRYVGVLAAAICVGVLLFGAALLSAFPRPVLGGLLVFLGLSFLAEWIYDAWSRLSRAEYVVVVLILLVIGGVGFLEGVAVGIVVAVVLFVVSYSRTDVVRHTLSGTTYRSTVERAAAARDLLREHGEAVHVLELQGYVFFGSSKSMVDRIAARATDPRLPPLRFLVLDFRRVTGVDSSALLGFSKALSLAETRGFAVVLTGVPAELSVRLAREGISEGGRGTVRIFRDLDHGMEWCEEEVLQGSAPAPGITEPLFAELKDSSGQTLDQARLLPYLTREEVPAGHRVIRQGDRADEIYFLEAGRLTAHLESDGEATTRLRTMGSGTVVGELPLYLDAPRTASVVSDTASTLYRLSLADFRRVEREDPELAAALHRMFARLMARRLADSLQAATALLD